MPHVYRMGPYFAASGAGGPAKPLSCRDGVGTCLPIPQGGLGAAELPWAMLSLGMVEIWGQRGKTPTWGGGMGKAPPGQTQNMDQLESS